MTSDVVLDEGLINETGKKCMNNQVYNVMTVECIYDHELLCMLLR